jgi:hypothetical protein
VVGIRRKPRSEAGQPTAKGPVEIVDVVPHGQRIPDLQHPTARHASPKKETAG